ncbi:MAG: L-threonylcarbamoyladenylate synthase [Dehalococcoidia bacterium]
MQTRIIAAEQWNAGLPVLRRGGLVGIPTDTVYGLAAMPLNAAAIDRIYEAKGRPADKAIPMLVSKLSHALRIAEISEPTRRLCDRLWPGALTVVALARLSFPSPAVASDGTVALRMPGLPLARLLIESAGGVLAVTSANRSGELPAQSAAEVVSQLDGRVELVLDGGPSPGGVASTIVRVRGKDVEVLREGAIPKSAINAAIRG